MSENRCVCCGEVIPEGGQVCPNCKKEAADLPVRKQITIRYPPDVTEKEAVLYAEGVFDSHKHDYRRKMEERRYGKRECSVLVFNDNRQGLFYVTKVGYVLELREKEE